MVVCCSSLRTITPAPNRSWRSHCPAFKGFFKGSPLPPVRTLAGLARRDDVRPGEDPPGAGRRVLDAAHVRGARTLRAVDDVETDAIAFGQALEAITLNGGVMHEDVRPPL